jgi:hypothetical protein
MWGNVQSALSGFSASSLVLHQGPAISHHSTPAFQPGVSSTQLEGVQAGFVPCNNFDFHFMNPTIHTGSMLTGWGDARRQFPQSFNASAQMQAYSVPLMVCVQPSVVDTVIPQRKRVFWQSDDSDLSSSMMRGALPMPRQRLDLTQPDHASMLAKPRTKARVLAADRMAAAFRDAAEDAASSFESDDSDLALRPSDPRQLASAVAEFRDLMAAAYADSTTSQDWGSHWTWWTQWCELWNTHPIRSVQAGLMTFYVKQREQFLMSAAVPWILCRMKPGAGRLWPQPESAAKVIRAVVRVHRTLGYELPENRQLGLVVKALQNRYVAIHGPEILQPNRKEPMGYVLFAALMALFSTVGHVLAGHRVEPTDLWLSLRVMAAVLYQTGLRKGEATSQTAHLHKKDMSRASLTWLIDGVAVVDPSSQQLQGMVSKRDYAALLPPASKCDQRGIVWGNQLIYLLFDTSQEFGAAVQLRELELSIPLHGTDRRTEPLFYGLQGRALSSSLADRILVAALKHLVPEDCKRYSWHSFRIQLACALLASGASNAAIMHICRWQDEESLKTYARMEPGQYAGLLERAFGKDFDQATSRYLRKDLPRICESEMYAQLHEVVI